MPDSHEDKLLSRISIASARIKRVADDLPRYNALSLIDKLTDRGDVMKAVPLAVVDTMNEAAEVISFFLGQMQMHSPSMSGEHRYRFISDGWPMSHCVGPSKENAVANAIQEVKKEKEKTTFTRAANE